MSTKKHTEEPWTVQGMTVYATPIKMSFGGLIREYRRPIGAVEWSGEINATFAENGNGDNVRLPSEEEAYANAALFKAAPVMLKRLEQIKNIVPSHTANEDYLWMAIGEMKKLAMDAIAQVEERELTKAERDAKVEDCIKQIAKLPPTVTPYFIHCEGVSGIASIPYNFTSENWKRLQDAFIELAIPKDAQDRNFIHVGSYRLWSDRQYEGVFWDEELAGPNGCSYLILPMGDSTAEQIKACEAKIRKDSDVVCLSVVKTTRWAGVELAKLVKKESAK